jgi:zinc/manganese transport system substrate-binding protein
VGAASADAAPLKVVASFTVLGDLAQQVGDDDVTVTTLVGADGDTHVFQPTPNDAKALKEADVIIINGLGFEGWMSRLIESSGTKAPVVTASQGIAKTLTMAEKEEEGHHDHHHHHGSTDPHAWQSLTNGRVYVKNIAAALQKADPANSQDYTDRAAKLDAELAALDAWVKKEIATVPEAKRRVITTHDAFGYFADAYQVTFLAPTGFSTEDEPSAKEMKQLIQQIKSGKTRALFFENMSNPNVIKQLATEAGAVVGPALYADALSGAAGNAPTYQAMFKYNVTALVKAMQQN